MKNHGKGSVTTSRDSTHKISPFDFLMEIHHTHFILKKKRHYVVKIQNTREQEIRMKSTSSYFTK